MTLFFSVSVFSEKKAEKTGKKSFWEKVHGFRKYHIFFHNSTRHPLFKGAYPK